MEGMVEIYRKYMPQVYKFLFSLCHDSHLSEELTQETFFQAIKSIDNFSVITNEEFEDVNLIKKIKKKNRRKALGIFVGAFILSGVLVGVGFRLTHGVARYENVTLNYGVQGDTAYLTMEGKPGYELNFSGTTDKNKSSLKVMYARNIWGNDKNIVRLEEECDKGGKPYQWILEFKDRIIVIEDGELVDEKIR